jgi:uncharacterized protein (TIGR02996 family)
MTRSEADPEAAALYRAILAHPDEDTPRLAYADRLDELGDAADRAYAEFVRVQCRVWRANTWDDGYTADRSRNWRLLREIGTRWRRPPGAPPATTEVPNTLTPTRGFAGAVKFFLREASPEQARDWFPHLPIRRAEYYFDEDQGDSLWLLTTDTLPHLRSIELNLRQFCPPALRPVIFRTLAAARVRSGLTRLEINSPLPLDDLTRLVTSPNLQRLESLSLQCTDAADAHARILADKMKLPALRELVLAYENFRQNSAPELTPVGAQALGAAEWFIRLRALRLSHHDKLGAKGLHAILGARPLPHLFALAVYDCANAKDGLGRVLGGPTLPGLRDLYVWNYYIDNALWLALTAGPQVLATLTAGKVALDAGTTDLFDRPALRDLRKLVLGGNQAPAVLEQLARSPLTQTLRSLSFSGQFRTDTAAPLLSGRDWPNLEYLFIDNSTPWKSLIALIESDKFPRLVGLKTRCAERMAMFVKRLAKCSAAARFRELELGGDLTAAALGALVESPHLDGIDRLALETRGTAKPEDRQRLKDRLGTRVEFELNQGR